MKIRTLYAQNYLRLVAQKLEHAKQKEISLHLIIFTFKDLPNLLNAQLQVRINSYMLVSLIPRLFA